jgi:hypothetical protein
LDALPTETELSADGPRLQGQSEDGGEEQIMSDAYDREQFDDAQIQDHREDDQKRALMAGVSGWLISLAAHGLIAMVLTTMVIFAEIEQESVPIKPVVLKPPEEKIEEKIEDQEFEEVQVQVEAQAAEEEVVEEVELPEETDLGVEEDVGEFDIMMGNQGAGDGLGDFDGDGGGFMAGAIGVGGGGAFMNRQGGNKKRAIGRNGGNRDSEAAVEAALRWFKRHQSPNGMWSCTDYQDNCTDAPKCEPGEGKQLAGDVAATGYAVLCYLGAGYDHVTPNNYRTTVRKGLDWLEQVGQQSDRGTMFSNNMYATAIGTMAIVEAYAMTMDPKLRRLSQAAVDYILFRQNPDPTQAGGKLGWNYNPTPFRHDTSVSGWSIMALKSAAAGGLDVGQGMRGALRMTKLGWQLANENHRSISSSDSSKFPYSFNPAGAMKSDNEADKTNGKPSLSGNNRQFIGAVCAVFLGVKAGDPMLESMMNAIMDQAPSEYPCNTYKLYYSTLAIFQAGGNRWNRWNSVARDLMVNSQAGAGTGCHEGSWGFEGTKFHGHDIGARLFSTAYVCLSLEVYYRYVRLH